MCYCLKHKCNYKVIETFIKQLEFVIDTANIIINERKKRRNRISVRIRENLIRDSKKQKITSGPTMLTHCQFLTPRPPLTPDACADMVEMQVSVCCLRESMKY